jgi:hypothetical protein
MESNYKQICDGFAVDLNLGLAISEVESFYDKANNRIRCFLPNERKTLVSVYDKRNQLITMQGYHGRVMAGEEPATTELTSYIYDANGQELSCTLPKTINKPPKLMIMHRAFSPAPPSMASSTATPLPTNATLLAINYKL